MRMRVLFAGWASLLAAAACSSQNEAPSESSGDASLDAPSGLDASGSDATGMDGTTGGETGSGADGSGAEAGSGDTGAPGCPPGLDCNPACDGSATTTLTGTVYDPAGKNPVYDVSVYVPSGPLQPLPRGVPTGGDACSCAALFKTPAITSTKTAADGTFTLTNVPAGTGVPLVLQIGKWRRLVHVNVTACQPNPQPDKSLALPGTVAAGDTDDNIPDIAVSTGAADTLECVLLRIGLPASEYVAGAATTGHVHVFAGGSTTGAGGAGRAETPGFAGAPASSTSLWSSASQLMPYDLTLLSCEGGETYAANPPALEQYLAAGGRVLASHFHYAWFAGPLSTGQMYSAPSDWGSNLATWSAAGMGLAAEVGGVIDTTLNGSTAAFPKGVALQKWLTTVNALGQGGEPAGQLPLYQPRYNASVSASNKPSQPWITASGTGQTLHFSFDAPVGAPPAADGGPPQYCGRAMFSEVHAAGDPAVTDTTTPPGGCATADLPPQQKAIEFMLFDLSGCVLPDDQSP